jgi:phosphoribosylglycinamide formyltransferase-1
LTGRRERFSAAVLVSGGGSNLQAFIDAVDAGTLNIAIPVVISNRPDAHGLERARRAGIEAVCIDHTRFPSREAFDAELAAALDGCNPGLVILAGFMRILTPGFVGQFAGRMLNIHPSLLPRYPGLNTHQRALEAGDRWHGSTVHFVTEQLDGGPAIVQGRVPVLAGDDAQSLAARVLAIEHQIYPHAVGLVAERRVEYRDEATWFDGAPMEQPILIES